MKVKQHSLQGFEFILDGENAERFISYFKANEPFLKGHTVILSGKGDLVEIEEFLKKNNVCYFIRNCELTTRKKSVKTLPDSYIEDIKKSIKESKKEKEQTQQQKNPKGRYREIIEKPIRSGHFISTTNDLLILSQINSGAEVETSGNLEIFGTINGKLECNGSYMLIRDIGDNGLVIFNKVILEKTKFKSKKAKLIKLDYNKRLIVEEL